MFSGYVKPSVSYNRFWKLVIESYSIKPFNEESIKMGNKGLIDLTDMGIKVFASDEKKPKLNILDVVSKLDWKDKCLVCGGKVTLVWTSPDGKVKAWKCQKGHSKRGQRIHTVWLVRE